MRETILAIIKQNSNYPALGDFVVKESEIMYTYGSDDEIGRMIEEIEQEFDVVLTISKDIGEMTVSEFINEVQQVVTS
jgi:hypothetical protein